jgi:hypothetical protein
MKKGRVPGQKWQAEQNEGSKVGVLENETTITSCFNTCFMYMVNVKIYCMTVVP